MLGSTPHTEARAALSAVLVYLGREELADGNACFRGQLGTFSKPTLCCRPEKFAVQHPLLPTPPPHAMMMPATAPCCAGKWSSLRRLVRPSAATRAAASDAAPSPLDLITWVTDNGGKCDGITVANLAGRDGGQGWGLKARADVPPGTKVGSTLTWTFARAKAQLVSPLICLLLLQLVDLPSRCQLTYDRSSDDPRLLKLIDAVPAELWGAKLALQVCLQAWDAGSWAAITRVVQYLLTHMNGHQLFCLNLPVRPSNSSWHTVSKVPSRPSAPTSPTCLWACRASPCSSAGRPSPPLSTRLSASRSRSAASGEPRACGAWGQVRVEGYPGIG